MALCLKALTNGGLWCNILLALLNTWKVVEVVLAEQPLLRTPLAYAKLTSAALVEDKSQQSKLTKYMESYRSGLSRAEGERP